LHHPVSAELLKSAALHGRPKLMAIDEHIPEFGGRGVQGRCLLPGSAGAGDLRKGLLGSPRTLSVIGEDGRRLVTDPAVLPWRPICRLTLYHASTEYTGTGWLAGPRTVITAAHNIFNLQLKELVEGILVTPCAHGENNPYGRVYATRFHFMEQWQLGAHREHDIGCIHLDKPFTADPGWLGLASPPDDALHDAQVTIAGYPADLSGQAMYEHRDSILQLDENFLYYATDTEAGQSGSPVLHADDSGNWWGVGVHAFSKHDIADQQGLEANGAPRITEAVIEQIRAWQRISEQVPMVLA